MVRNNVALFSDIQDLCLFFTHFEIERLHFILMLKMNDMSIKVLPFYGQGKGFTFQCLQQSEPLIDLPSDLYKADQQNCLILLSSA